MDGFSAVFLSVCGVNVLCVLYDPLLALVKRGKTETRQQCV